MPSPKNGKRTRRANNGGAKKKGGPTSTKAASNPLTVSAQASRDKKKATKAGKSSPVAASNPLTVSAQASRDKKKTAKAGKAPAAASNPLTVSAQASRGKKKTAKAGKAPAARPSTDNMGPPITLRNEAIGAAEQQGVLKSSNSSPSKAAPSKATPSKTAPGGAAPGRAAAPGGSDPAIWKPPALSSMKKEMHNKIAKMMELSTVPTIVEGLTSNVTDDLTIWLDGTLSGKYNVNAKWPGYEKLPDTNRLFDQDGTPLCVGMQKHVYGSLQHIINRKTEKEKGEDAREAAGDLQGHITPEANALDKMHQSNCGTDKQSWHLWTGRKPDAAKKPHTTLDPKAEEGKAAVAMVNVIAHNSAQTSRNKLGFHKTTPAGVFEDIQGELSNKCKYGTPERTFKGELLQWVNKTKDSEQKRNAVTILSKDGKYLPSYPGEADEFKSLMSSLMEIGENIRGNQKYEKHINSLFRILLLAFSCYASRLVACWGAYARAVVIAKEWGLPSPVQAAKTMISDCMDCTVTSMTAPQHSRAIEQAQCDYIVAAFAWNSAAPSNRQWVYPAVTPPATDPTTSVPLDREAS